MATGKHDHVGQSCGGRHEGLFAGEGMLCVAGRLESKRRPHVR